jgi:hypothetical protein
VLRGNFHHADDGYAGGRGSGVDDDVPPATGRAELPAVVGRACLPSLWVYSPQWVIPSLVLVEVWHWTPLVMLIVLGGLAALPTEPYESAKLDGATEWQLFRYITLPLVAPFLLVAGVIRTIDALKAFDTIYVITSGGTRDGVRNHQSLSVPAGLRLLQHRQRIRGGRDLLLHRDGAGVAAALRAPEDQMDVTVAPAVPPLRRSRLPVAPLAAQGRVRVLGRGDRVAGHPGFPLDAVAVAEKRNRQHCVSAGLHTFAADIRQLRVGVRAEFDVQVFLEQCRRLGRRHADCAGDRHPRRLRHCAHGRAPALRC